MGEIKSALEIALEKTRDVQSDKQGLVLREMEERGKRLFSQFRENPDLNVQKEIDATAKEHRQAVRRGFFDVALANLSLPQVPEDIESYDLIKQALIAVVRDKRFVQQLFDQLGDFMQRYLDDRQHLIETLRSRFADQMKAQEQELSRQTGRQVKLDPAQSPEFAKALSRNMQQLQSQYRGVLDQVRAELTRVFEQNR